MTLVLFFAFLSGFVTILAPCIWPLLPVILSASSTGEKRRPLGITLGILFSFALFTLTVSYIVSVLPIDPNAFRLISVLVIGFFGLTLIIPALSGLVEGLVSRLTSKMGSSLSPVQGSNSNGFVGGVVTGSALGLVWSPCAGPILATIATLAATRAVNTEIVLVTFVYLLGVGIPLFLFAQLGSRIFAKTVKVSRYTHRIQQVFGVIMIATAIAIYTGYDRVLQTRLLEVFPSYSSFLTRLESNPQVLEELRRLGGRENAGGTVFSPSGMVEEGVSLPRLGPAPEFTGITNWLNSEPQTLEGLKGKVVLVDFWTYTCINCIRTMPYLTAWDEKYRDSGLVIVGVHAPEFEFEKSTANVQQAIDQYEIAYPVAQDNDFATWQAYNNQYWPAKYLIDATGEVRYVHFGEGKYEETELAIQSLLEEAGQEVNQAVEAEAAPERKRISPETYLGNQRMLFLWQEGKAPLGTNRYVLNEFLPVNRFSFGGTWTVNAEDSVPAVGSTLQYRFSGKDVFLVMRPEEEGVARDVEVWLDGVRVQTGAGPDVQSGSVTVDSDRLYHLIQLEESGEHLLELRFPEGGIQAFAFTFG